MTTTITSAADRYAKRKGVNWCAKEIGKCTLGSVFVVFHCDRVSRTTDGSHHVIVTDDGRVLTRLPNGNH